MALILLLGACRTDPIVPGRPVRKGEDRVVEAQAAAPDPVLPGLEPPGLAVPASPVGACVPVPVLVPVLLKPARPRPGRYQGCRQLSASAMESYYQTSLALRHG